MSQTNIVAQSPFGPYGTPGAAALDLTETAADVSNGNKFTLTNRDVLLVHNTGGSAYTITLTSVADTKGRTGDVTTYSVAAGAISMFNFRGGLEGWAQADGSVHIAASNAAVKFAVLTFGT